MFPHPVDPVDPVRIFFRRTAGSEVLPPCVLKARQLTGPIAFVTRRVLSSGQELDKRGDV